MNRTIKGIKQNGEEVWFSPQELRASELNAWQGWTCSVGQKNIAIDENGNMQGGDCGIGGNLGNIYGEFRIPNKDEWHVCPLKHCSCFFDKGVRKFSKDENSKFYSFEDPNLPLKFEWFLSSKCNYECWYCPKDYHSKLPHKNSTDNVMKGLDNLFNKLRGKTFTMGFWGGEPTLFPGYIEICKKINNYGSRVFTTTNGSRSVAFYTKLINYSCISLSVHQQFFDEKRMINNIKAILEEKRKIKTKNWLMIRLMVAPGSLSYWKIFLKKLETEVPKFTQEAKVTLNSLVGLSDDLSEWTDNIMEGYTSKELEILTKYGRLTEK